LVKCAVLGRSEAHDGLPIASDYKLLAGFNTSEELEKFGFGLLDGDRFGHEARLEDDQGQLTEMVALEKTCSGA
jgi:hypothetical protein